MTADLINGLFELGGGLTLCLNVRALWRDRRLQGVHWAPVLFFTSWGAWNLFYYPHLGQWASFAGGLVVVTCNAAWLVLAGWFWLFKHRPILASAIIARVDYRFALRLARTATGDAEIRQRIFEEIEARHGLDAVGRIADQLAAAAREGRFSPPLRP